MASNPGGEVDEEDSDSYDTEMEQTVYWDDDEEDNDKGKSKTVEM